MTQHSPPRSVVGAQLADMSRTLNLGTAAGGLPTGAPVRSLMQTDLEPGEYTLQFSVIPPSDGLGFAAYAIVNWKVAGHQLRRCVSIASGAVISGVADAVDVVIVDVSGQNVFPPLPNGNPDPRQLYKVAATLSRGSRPSLNQPAVLVTQQAAIAVPAAGGQSFLVPPDCGVISFFPLLPLPTPPDVTTSVNVSQRDAGGVPQGFVSAAGQNNWIPLVSGTSFIRISNGGANPINGNILWGVDG